MNRLRREPVVFGLCLAVGLVATFRFHYFASWDGPAHAASARGMWQYEGAIAQLFRRDWFPSPNLVAHLYESALLPVFGPTLADRIVAASCVVAVAYGFRFLARSIDSAAGALMSYVGLPFAFGWFVHGGQYSFLLGVAAALLYLGWRLRAVASQSRCNPALVAAALVGLYLCHIIPLAVVLLVQAVTSVKLLRERMWRPLLTEWAPAVPALALTFAYVVAAKAVRPGDAR